MGISTAGIFHCFHLIGCFSRMVEIGRPPMTLVPATVCPAPTITATASWYSSSVSHLKHTWSMTAFSSSGSSWYTVMAMCHLSINLHTSSAKVGGSILYVAGLKYQNLCPGFGSFSPFAMRSAFSFSHAAFFASLSFSIFSGIPSLST